MPNLGKMTGLLLHARSFYRGQQTGRFLELNREPLAALQKQRAAVWHPDHSKPLSAAQVDGVGDCSIVRRYVEGLLTHLSKDLPCDLARFNNALEEQVVGEGENFLVGLGYSTHPLAVRSPILIRAALHPATSAPLIKAYSKMVSTATLSRGIGNLPPLSEKDKKEIRELFDYLQNCAGHNSALDPKEIEEILMFLTRLISFPDKRMDGSTTAAVLGGVFSQRPGL